MRRVIARYAHWLHLQWPAGQVEKLPRLDQHGRTSVPGLYVVGDLTGIPLLKFAADSGARAVQHLAADPQFHRLRQEHPQAEILDLAIVGAGVSGLAAALAARRAGLSFAVFEASEPLATIAGFPAGKPIYAYPTGMVPAGELQIHATVKEDLLAELRAQTLGQGIKPRPARVEAVARRGGLLELVIPGQERVQARRVIAAVGRSGEYRRLGVPGEDQEQVYHRLHDPAGFAGQEVLVVGGGDSALEAAVALARAGGRVCLSYRGREFTRPKPENVEQVHRLAGSGGLRLLLGSQVQRLEAGAVRLRSAAGEELRLPNQAVFAMVGRQAPLDFFRRSGVQIQGEWQRRTWVGLVLALLAVLFVSHWKSDVGIPVKRWFQEAGLFPFGLGRPEDPSTLAGTILVSMGQPGFYYSLAYSLCVALFGYRRVRRHPTPYVRVQTLVLALIQWLPLFLLPYVFLPWAGYHGWFAEGTWLGKVADALFPASLWAEHGREYWRVMGLILAWPLFLWNVFTSQPMWAWLAIGAVQTFLLIPLLVWRWGKGAYCGWICSCGALAETLGDTQRHKMPHGPRWNRLNLLGQVLLVLVFLLLGLRLAGWLLGPGHWVNSLYAALFTGKRADWSSLPFPLSLLNYVWSVDLFLSGVLGVGLYWHASGRVWCRFACPLAALMHVYARFSRFRILADKKRCISCNACTAICHQGIDVMSFAVRGQPMADPQCVRCSACVEVCPTGVLEFGQVARDGAVQHRDRLAALSRLSRQNRDSIIPKNT